MRTFCLLFCGLFSMSATAQIDTSIYSRQQPLDLGGSIEKGVNLANAIQQKKIADEQLKQLKLQNEMLEKSKSTPEIQSNDAETSAKLTVNYPNHEEKIFHFNKLFELQSIQIGPKTFECRIAFQNLTINGKISLAEIDCNPVLKHMKDGPTIFFGTRSLCQANSPGSIFFIYDKNPKTNKLDEYSMTFSCGNEL